MKYFKPEIDIDYFDEDVITVSNPKQDSLDNNNEDTNMEGWTPFT